MHRRLRSVAMRSPIPSLIDLEAFEAAARHGSFVAAAGELHLTPSAVIVCGHWSVSWV
jgi:hypothetical protein